MMVSSVKPSNFNTQRPLSNSEDEASTSAINSNDSITLTSNQKKIIEVNLGIGSLLSHTELNEIDDIYQPLLLSLGANNKDNSSTNEIQQLQNTITQTCNFAQLLLSVQLTNIKGGAEIAAVLGEVQEKLNSVQEGLGAYLRANADFKIKQSKLNADIRNEELREAYKKMAEELKAAAEMQRGFGIGMFCLGAVLAVFTPVCPALGVAGLGLIVAGASAFVDAAEKLKNADQLLNLCDKTNQPFSEAEASMLLRGAQQGLANNQAFKIFNFASQAIIAATAIGLEIATAGGATPLVIITVGMMCVGMAADLCDFIMSEANQEYNDTQPSNNDDLSRTKKAMGYLKQWSGGVSGASMATIQALSNELIIPLVHGWGENDHRSADEKQRDEWIVMGVSTLVGVGVAGVMAYRATKNVEKQLEAAGKELGDELDKKAAELRKDLLKVKGALTTGQMLISTVNDSVNAYNQLACMAPVENDKATLTYILTQLQAALDMINRLSTLKEQLANDQQKTLQQQQDSLASEINSLIQTIQNKIDAMNIAINHSSY